MNSVSSPVLLARTYNAINLTSSSTAIGRLLPQVEDIEAKGLQNIDFYLKLSGLYCTYPLPVYDVFIHTGKGKAVLLSPLSFFGVQPRSSANRVGSEIGIKIPPSLTHALTQSLLMRKAIHLSIEPQERQQSDGHAVIETIRLFAVPSRS